LISIIVPVVSTLIKNPSVQKFLYWLFNIISPSINAQVLITYILAHKSQFCKFMTTSSSTDNSKSSLFKSIGDDTIAVNGVLLVLHILLLLFLLILIDSGLLQFTFSCLYESDFDENTLDDDVSAERHRVLGLQTTLSIDEEQIDHLIVNDLVKYYPGRHVLAVNHLTFGAKRGEAFGLLGYNVRIKIFFK
jgi:hypothetical protein